MWSNFLVLMLKRIFSFSHESLKRVPSKLYIMKGIWFKISTEQVIKVWSVWKINDWAIFKFQKGRWAKIRDFDAEKKLGLKMFMASDFVQ